MSGLALTVLGSYSANLDGRPLPKFPTVRSQALFIYLAVEVAFGVAAQRRETLVELLWPGMPAQSGRKNLRQTIYYLRQTLGDAQGDVPFLFADRSSVEINPDFPFELDVTDFLGLLAGPREGWPTAVELYRGDFLADFYLADSADYEAWILARREFFRRRALETLEALTVQSTHRRNYDLARGYAERQLEIDNLRESAYRQLMEILARAGYREEALAHYETCRRFLAEELGMAPSARTSDLYRRIQAGEVSQEPLLVRDVRGYELKEQIGEGAFGVIYRALQPSVGREVAIKIIRQKYADDPAFIRRFEFEAQTIARLEHPYIVPLYDFWRDPAGAYLVMRYMRGGDLRTILENGAWPADSCLKMLEQISAALATAHRQDIVHRDVKPANIFFDQEGIAYLSDFGIAKSLADGAPLPDVGVMAGTPEYASPEQFMDEPVGPQADIYSLGIVLYETLTGQKPFAGEAIAKLIQSQLNEPIPPVTASRPDLPPQVDEVIHRATAKRPADRYADVLQLAEAFTLALQDKAERPSAVSAIRPDEIVNPYKGLRAFQEADANDFFGREALVSQLTGRLGESRFLAIVGPSGSGKSSLVKAGLIPALRRGALPGSDKWYVAEMVPGTHPLEELELALWPIAVDPPPSLIEPMERDNRGLLRTIRRILPDEEEAQLLLVIDQFEELFTLVDDEARRNHFLDSLLVALTAPRTPLRVVVTLRADFYDRPLQYQPIARLFKDHAELLLPLNREELAEAIQEPARRVGVAFEDGIVAAIVADVGDQPGALPLMQYALTELFEARQNHMMTYRAYEEIGGVLGALGRRAEELYADLDTAGQEAARQLFLRLVTPGEGGQDARRRLLRSELETLQGEVGPPTPAPAELNLSTSNSLFTIHHSQFSAIVDQFGQARLLTFDRDPLTREPTVEVAHEALLREWERLRDWLDENRTDIRMQRLLAAAAGEWLAAGRDDGYLLHGLRLTRYEAWSANSTLALTRDELTFLEASLAARQQREAEDEARRQRELETAQRLAETEKARAEEQSQAAQRLRRRALYLGVALVVAAILAIAAIVAGSQASRSADLAENEAQARATQQAVAERNADLAQEEAAARATEQARAERSAAESRSLALASGARAALANKETDQALALALAANDLDNSPAFAQQMLYEAALAPGTIRRIDGGGVFRWKMDLHPDGHIVASAADDGAITLWDVDTGAEIIRLEGAHEEPLGDVVFTPDGQGLLSGGFDDLIVLWDVQTGEVIRSMRNPGGDENPWDGDVNSLDITPDGRLAIAATGRGLATLWDLQTGDMVGQLAGHDPELQLQPAVFSPDGRLAATGSEDGTVILWDVAAQSLLQRLEGHDDVVFALAFSPDGKTLASASFDNTIILWDVASAEALFTLEGHNDFVFDVAFNEDGTQLLSSSRDQSVIRWDVATGEPLQTYQGEAGRILSVDYIDEERAISTASTGNLRIWALDDEMVLENHRLADDLLVSLAQSEDGRLAAAGLNEEVRLRDLKTGEILADFPMPVEIPEDLPLSQGDVTALAFDRSVGKLLVGLDEGSIILWDIERGQEVHAYEGHTNRILDLAFSPDGERFLSASDDKTAILWDLQSSDIVRRFESPTDTINAAAFSPDGRLIAAGFGTFRYLIEGDYQDNNIRLWDAATGEEIRQLAGHEGPVTALQFSPDGRTLLSGSVDETVRLWDVDSGEQLRRFDGHTGGVFSVAFSPDGEYAASGAADAAVIVWQVATGDRLRQLVGHEGVVHHVNFEENGHELWSAAEDGRLLLWNLSLDLDELRAWARANRYVPEFTCNQRAQYRIEPLCEPDN